MSKSKINSFISGSKARLFWLMLLVSMFVCPIIINGPTDHEEYLNTTISALLNAKHLQENGNFLLWADNLGFGTPMPLGHDNTLNPIFWVWPIVSLSGLMGIYWFLFTFLGTVYFSRILNNLRITGIVFYTALVSYICSMPYLTFMYQNDWPTLFFEWAMFPVWFYYAFMLVEKHHHTKPFFATIRLGLLIGMCIANAHYGYLSVLLISSGIVIFSLALNKPVVFFHFIFAGIIAAIIGSANMYYVMSEVVLFPDNMERVAQNGYNLQQVLAAFVQPFSLEWLKSPNFTFNTDEIWNSFLSVNRGVRVLVFGAPFMVAAIFATFFYVIRKQWKETSFAIGFVFAFGMSLLNPDDLYHIPSGTWLFRDITVFFGILLAAGLVQKLSVTKKLLVAVPQMVIVVSLAIPTIYYNFHSHSYYRDAETPTSLVDGIIKNSKGYGTRIYFAPNVSKYLERGRNELLNDPLELALYGMSPVNGWFKGVSQDAFFPSASLMHGFIRGNKETLQNQKILDLMGIELVVANDSDLAANPDLSQIWHKDLEDGNTIYLLHNKTAWKRAWIMDISAQEIQIKPYNGCNLSGFLCADVSELSATFLPDEVTVYGGNGKMRAAFPPSKTARLLVFSTLYRKDWQAYSSDQKLDVLPLADALLSVRIPPHVTEIIFEYKPETRLMLRMAGLICFSASIAFLVISAIRSRKSTGKNA